MSDILKYENVSVETDLDRVIFTAGRTVFPIPYATAFRIAAGMRMACKQSMRVTKEPLANVKKYMQGDYTVKIAEVNPIKQNLPVQKFEWRCDYQGERVYLVMGNNEVSFHFTDALKVSAWIRLGGEQAKRWAGDTSRTMHTVGVLTDAEDNYKRGHE